MCVCVCVCVCAAAAEVDGDIHSPISVEAFPAHVRNMHENSDRPFSEEFQVSSYLVEIQTIHHYHSLATFNLLSLAPNYFVGFIHQVPKPAQCSEL